MIENNQNEVSDYEEEKRIKKLKITRNEFEIKIWHNMFGFGFSYDTILQKIEPLSVLNIIRRKQYE